MLKQYTFHRGEHLKSKKIIGQLFRERSMSIHEYPIRAVWTQADIRISYPIQVAITVPQKHFRRAVERNRIKRLIHEAYRQHKSVLYEFLSGKKSKVALMLIFTGQEIPTFQLVCEKIILILNRFREGYETSQ